MRIDRWLFIVPLRLRSVFRRQQVEQDLHDELQLHVEELTRANIAQGMQPDQARSAARRTMRGVESVKDQCRDARRVALLENAVRDVRHAGRLLGRSPTFAAVAILSIAIGVGGNTAVFSVVNALLFRPAAGVVEPDRLVDILAFQKDGAFGSDSLSYPNYLDIRDRVTSFVGLYAKQDLDQMSLGGAGDTGAERVFGARVSGNYFDVLGARAHTGRLLGADDDRTSESVPVAVISHQLWIRRFSADPAIVSSRILLDGHPVTVVGVAAEGFHGTTLFAPDVWVPFATLVHTAPAYGATLLKDRAAALLTLGGRLSPGASVQSAQAELTSLALILERDHPVENRGRGLRVAPVSMFPGGDASGAAIFLGILMAMVGLVLVVTCANLAAVLLSRGTERSHEIAIRLALGAGRMRITSQLLTETVLLFLAGGTAGLAIAQFATTIAVRLLPALPVPFDVSLPIDGRVLLFTLMLSFAAALICGLAPALQTTNVDVVPALKDTRQRFRPSRLRSVFLVGQIVFSLVLVVAAALLVRALEKASSADLGFKSSGVEVTEISLSLGGYSETTGRAFVRDIVGRARLIPGVVSATAAAGLPLGPMMMNLGSLLPPGSTPERAMGPNAPGWSLVEPYYFSTMGTVLVSGREFTATDVSGAPPVVILNETAARRFWPGENPIGKRLLHYPYSGGMLIKGKTWIDDAYEVTVVGIAKDGKYRSVGESARPHVFAPFQQQFSPTVAILTRTTDGRAIAANIRQLLSSSNPGLPVLTAQSLEEYTSLGLLAIRVAATMASGLSGVSLLLATIGIYGMASYSVSQRTREIGIRIAVGARSSDVLALVFRQALVLTGIGVVVGLLLSAVASRALSTLLFGLSPFDPASFAFVACLFAAVALGASYLPARRALGIDPTVALRER